MIVLRSQVQCEGLIMKAKSPNNTNFLKIGSKVVFIDDDMPSHIMTVSGLDHDGIFMDDDRKFAIRDIIRIATEQEILANCRMVNTDENELPFI